MSLSWVCVFFFFCLFVLFALYKDFVVKLHNKVAILCRIAFSTYRSELSRFWPDLIFG